MLIFICCVEKQLLFGNDNIAIALICYQILYYKDNYNFIISPMVKRIGWFSKIRSEQMLNFQVSKWPYNTEKCTTIQDLPLRYSKCLCRSATVILRK